MHPATHIMNYATRSVSGLRHKDVEKVAEASRILEDPDFQAELIEGELSGLAEFACAVDAMRMGRLELGSQYLRIDATQIDLDMARFKGKFLRWLEGNDAIVDLALHGPIQKILKPFVGNA